MPALPSKSNDISAAVTAGCIPLQSHKKPIENRNTSSRFIFNPFEHTILAKTAALTTPQGAVIMIAAGS